jgi:excisionase family DNA binding protein
MSDHEPNESVHGAESVELAGATLAQIATKKIFTTGEAAALCKVSQQTIIRCFDSGRLTGFRVPGSKFRRIPRDELVRFMRANSIPTDVLQPSENGHKRRVLVVDDDPAIVQLYLDALATDIRFEVRSASTGYDAGMLTESFKPDMIILDYMLPDLNGNIVCQRIRARPEFSGTKILCVSGVVREAEIAALRASGADDFLSKPFDIAVLLQRVRSLAGLEAGRA